jgi:hypothetical protein
MGGNIERRPTMVLDKYDKPFFEVLRHTAREVLRRVFLL